MSKNVTKCQRMSDMSKMLQGVKKCQMCQKKSYNDDKMPISVKNVSKNVTYVRYVKYVKKLSTVSKNVIKCQNCQEVSKCQQI